MVVKGTMAVDRALSVLSVVLDRRDAGVRSVEVARLAGVHEATAHRLLKALVRARMVAFDGYQKKYYLGARLADLWVVAPAAALEHLNQAAQAVCLATGDTVYVYARSGLDIVCVQRLEGTYPVRALIRSVGSHLPLGANSGSAHLLACLEPAAARRVLEMNAERFGAFKGLTIEEVWAEVQASRVRGFGVNDNRVLPGVSSVGVAWLDADHVPSGCICVSAISARLDPGRRTWVAEQIAASLRSVGMQAG